VREVVGSTRADRPAGEISDDRHERRVEDRYGQHQHGKHQHRQDTTRV